MGRFIIRTQGGSILDVCTKFEADSSIRSTVIMGSQNFEIGSRNRKPRPFWILNVKFVYKSIYTYWLPNFILLSW